MADLFSRNVSTLGGVFTSDRAKLFLQGALAILVQRLNFNYSQTITRLYEVGGPNIYYVGGRTQGQLSISRVVGPSGTVAQLYAQYGNVCNAPQNQIHFALQETDCRTSGAIASRATNYDMLNCVITSVAIGVESQGMIISEDTTMTFSSLEAA